LGGGIHPTSEWRQGEIVKEEYYLLVPRDVGAGTYRIRMRIGRGPPDLSASPSGVTGTDVQVLGEVTVQ
jgi:hypothetical protein